MKKFKRTLSLLLMMVALVTAALPVSAAGASGNGLTLSTNTLTLSEGSVASVTAVLPEGLDANKLTFMTADPAVVTVTKSAVAGNAAAFLFTFAGNGNTSVAIFHEDNPAVVGYVAVNASQLILSIPKHLGDNKKNYCSIKDITFEPYSFTYADFQDYKYKMKLQFTCDSYKDTDLTKWGAFGYFYDANGNIISKVHLYARALSKGRTYKDECNVPVNAVRFEIEGWN